MVTQTRDQMNPNRNRALLWTLGIFALLLVIGYIAYANMYDEEVMVEENTAGYGVTAE